MAAASAAGKMDDRSRPMARHHRVQALSRHKSVFDDAIDVGRYTAAREIIEDNRNKPLPGQFLADKAPDISGGSGDEDAMRRRHRASIAPRSDTSIRYQIRSPVLLLFI